MFRLKILVIFHSECSVLPSYFRPEQHDNTNITHSAEFSMQGTSVKDRFGYFGDVAYIVDSTCQVPSVSSFLQPDYRTVMITDHFICSLSLRLKASSLKPTELFSSFFR